MEDSGEGKNVEKRSKKLAAVSPGLARHPKVLVLFLLLLILVKGQQLQLAAHQVRMRFTLLNGYKLKGQIVKEEYFKV